ncbi:MAG: substrate-binding domain-containing protein [Phycisphaerae bacterium]|nr:substrate-binding domain-containing protein [Phycisphaerae bacterium]
MCTRPVHQLCLRFTIVLAALATVMAPEALAQEVLRLYGPLGPSPAVKEAAMVFGKRHNVEMNVVAGPTADWLNMATGDADLVYSSAEYMMSGFMRNKDLQVDAASVRPLYLRPSAILVRPGNPKGIHDLPDLLKPGVKVMVVTGSGQTGLWEDMASKLGDIRTFRAFRQNIAYFAPNSAEAKKAWFERDDIDAWLTWSIWYMPLRDRAEHIRVSTHYRVYRQCSVALTQRGKAKPLAAKFIDFLLSPDGAKIFESWGWTAPPHGASPLAVHKDICVVCRVKNDEWKGKVGLGLACVRRLVKDYEYIGIRHNEVHISVVFHGDAGYWMLKDGPYEAFTKKAGGNPNKAIIRELVDLGVSVELCAQTMKERGWTRQDVLPEVKIVIGAYPRIIDLELQGYAYIRF